eukprot:TRINITY_DN10207_c0_g2_i3.p1 TRINITY_DN10207_c0_g2~~TRINITY_DN10207_c0_g2_i3.p1  ORF type:complete len:471 (-),score=80.78 TRINITY_DN10207_c0_g2_i3:3-1415(-)
MILEDHLAYVKVVAWGLNGLLATGSNDETAKVWTTLTGECLHTLRGHRHMVKSVGFSPDGTMLATGSLDNTTRMWAVQTGECLHIWGFREQPEWAINSSQGGQHSELRSRAWHPDDPETVGFTFDSFISSFSILGDRAFFLESSRLHVLHKTGLSFPRSQSTLQHTSSASVDEQFDIIVSYRTEVHEEMLMLVAALQARFGARCVVHGLMCRPGQPWDAGYFAWLRHAKVKLILLSPGYFKSAACRLEFKEACNQVPDPRVADQAVIPVVVTSLPWKYPAADPHCPPDLQAQLNQRNCYPDPNEGAVMDDPERFLPGLISVIEPFLGYGGAQSESPADHSSGMFRARSHGLSPRNPRRDRRKWFRPHGQKKPEKRVGLSRLRSCIGDAGELESNETRSESNDIEAVFDTYRRKTIQQLRLAMQSRGQSEIGARSRHELIVRLVAWDSVIRVAPTDQLELRKQLSNLSQYL